MGQALRLQRHERLAEAADVYAAVLERAPDTHDALHMLGAIKLRLNELDEARRLIVAAMKLRPPYPAIEHNLKLIQGAQRKAEEESRRQPVPPIQLCELALPVLVDLALRPSASRPGRRPRVTGTKPSSAETVHLILHASMVDADPGWLARRLASLLTEENLEVWSAGGVDLSTAPRATTCRLNPEAGSFPRGGCQIHVGADVASTDWLRHADAERIVVICAPRSPAELIERLRAISGDGAQPVELVFPSRAMAARFGEGHAILPPPVELAAETRGARRERGTAARLAGLAVGGVGRNWGGEPLDADAQFLKGVAAEAGALRLYDAGRLRFHLGDEASIRFCSRHDMRFVQFAEALDCLVFTAAPWWREEDGRELFSAMESGVPALLPVASIYAEYIDHGVDGLLYASSEDALQRLAELRRAPARLDELGRAARAKVTGLVSAEALQGILRQLVTGQAAAGESAAAGEQVFKAVA
ncbi:MAG TPA: hypothetical protein VF420_15360 [Casimicrobiaceae bacterium]